MARCLLLALLALRGHPSSSSSSSERCATALDCGLNGACVAGACVCDKPWTGTTCSSLALGTASRAGGYHVPRTTSWGGSVLRHDDGRYYMWAAEMVGSCGLGAWTRNSRVIIASSPNATGPFAYERQLAGVFSHEPAATRAPTGTYVVYFTSSAFGCNRSAFGETSTGCVSQRFCAAANRSDCPPPGGSTCWSGCMDGSSSAACRDDKTIEHAADTLFPTFMTWATHPLGPYSEPVMVYDGVAQTSDPSRSSGDTNFAGVIAGDGSVVGLWRGGGAGKACKRSVAAQHCGGQYQYLARASHWRDPKSYEWGAPSHARNVFPSLGVGELSNCGIEDPTVWRDRNGNLHALLHNWAAGGHAASDDNGSTWRWYGGNCSAKVGPSSVDWSKSAWPATVSFTD
eukprot:COSAG04_NODE_5643_length_1542_cov_2.119889_1_plen_399_part_01